MNPQELKTGKFWDRPEAIPVMIFYALIGAGLIWFWGSVVGFLLSAALDTLHLAIVGGVLVSLWWAVTSKKVHYIGRSLARWVTGWFVNLDPIGIRKTHIEETEKKKADLEKSVGDIRGLRINLTRKKQENETHYRDSMLKIQAANNSLNSAAVTEDHKQQAQRVLRMESKYADGLESTIKRQAERLERYNMIVTVLSRYGEMCDDTIIELKREVELQEQEREESKGFAKGMRAAFGILRGSGVDFEMDDMARKQLEDDYTKRMGEVENILELTRDVVLKADMNDEASLLAIKARLDSFNAPKAIEAPPLSIPAAALKQTEKIKQ